MKAWVIREFRNENNLLLENKQLEELGRNEVRISIKACGINNKDNYLRKGIYFQKKSLPMILGSDISGIITETGKSVTEFKNKERVLVSPIVGCNSCNYCLNGEENKCSKYSSILGGFAEEIVVNVNNILPIPGKLSFVEAAALPISYLTAWNMLHNKISSLDDKTVLFWGATSGVGTAGILLYDQRDRSIAMTGSKQKEHKLRQLGLSRVINYESNNIVEKIQEYTKDQGVDIIFDPIGAKAWKTNKEILKPNGIHVNCGRNTGEEVNLDLGWLFSNQIQIIGAKSGSKKDLKKLLEYINKRNIRPIIDRTFSFQKAEEALQYLEKGEHFGKIIINLEE